MLISYSVKHVCASFERRDRAQRSLRMHGCCVPALGYSNSRGSSHVPKINEPTLWTVLWSERLWTALWSEPFNLSVDQILCSRVARNKVIYMSIWPSSIQFMSLLYNGSFKWTALKWTALSKEPTFPSLGALLNCRIFKASRDKYNERIFLYNSVADIILKCHQPDRQSLLLYSWKFS